MRNIDDLTQGLGVSNSRSFLKLQSLCRMGRWPLAGLHGAEGSTSHVAVGRRPQLLTTGSSPKGCLRWWRASPQASDPRAEGKPPCLSGSSLRSDLPRLLPFPSGIHTKPSTVWERTTQGRIPFCRLAPEPHPSPAHNTQAMLLERDPLHSLALPLPSLCAFTHAVPSAWKSFPSHLSLAKVYSCFKIQIRTFFLENFS